MMNKEPKNEIEKIDTSINSVPNSRLENVFGGFETVTSAPTLTPVTLRQKIKIYNSGGTKRLYIYDDTNNTWLYATLT